MTNVSDGARLWPAGSKLPRYVVDVHGAAGEAWLRRLPGLLARWAERWSLTLLPAFADLSFHYVAPARRADGTPVVLKATVPNVEQRREAAALRLAAGQGLVRCLEADPQEGVMVLARVLPGTPLAALDDEEAITVAALEVLLRIWRPLPAGTGPGVQEGAAMPFVTVAQWAQDLATLHATFADGYGPFPRELVDRAEGLFGELVDAGAAPMLLHGDPHPQNFLRSETEGWLAIDPKGLVGDPLYDVADYVCSVPRSDDPATVRRRLARRAALAGEIVGCGAEVLLRWGLAQAVLSGWWSYEDHGAGWEHAFGLAGAFAALLD